MQGAAAGLSAVNAVRSAAGARRFQCLPALAAIAAAHAAYLAANDGADSADRHREVPGKTGFTGATLPERATHGGIEHDAFWLSEGIGGRGRPADVVAAHIASVYHRSHLLTPGGRYFGYAEAQGRLLEPVMDSLAWLDVEGLLPIVYPADGAADVPPRFGADRETPDPVPGTAAPGFPISVHFPRYLDRDTGVEPIADVTSFTLATEAGEAVDTVTIAPSTDAVVAASDVFLVPTAPLVADTDYVAEARVSYGRMRIERRWRFHTKGE